MANLKNITDLPVVESTDGINLIVNDNGAAKQVPADAIGKVKTVNGFEPDENGNVQIDTASSWNDLKDKPFYAEPKIILERQVIDGFTTEGEDYRVLLPYKIDYPDGVTLTVFWDGTEYNCISVDGCLGNAVAITGQPDDVPFVIVREADGSKSGIVALTPITGDTSTSHEIGIVGETVHKLDTKYLPGFIFYIDAWYENSRITTNTNFYDVVSAVRSGALVVLRLDRSAQGGSISIEQCTNYTMDDNSFNFQTSDFPVILMTDHIYEDN